MKIIIYDNKTGKEIKEAGVRSIRHFLTKNNYGISFFNKRPPRVFSTNRYGIRLEAEPKYEKTIKIDYDRFCSWYFDEDCRQTTIENLIESGYKSVEEIANGVNYIPVSLIENIDDINPEDIEDDELESPGDSYNVKLIKRGKK